MDAQRVRNLTTFKLHTKMEDIYSDVEFITGAKGVMTHMLPNAVKALQPYLKEYAIDQKFWDGSYDKTHIGDVDIPPMSQEEQKEFWELYGSLPSPFSQQ